MRWYIECVFAFVLIIVENEFSLLSFSLDLDLNIYHTFTISLARHQRSSDENDRIFELGGNILVSL